VPRHCHAGAAGLCVKVEVLMIVNVQVEVLCVVTTGV
jgi:hypothetical protein